MEKNSESRKHENAMIPRSPSLIRSRSGTSSSEQKQTYNVIPTKKVNPKEAVEVLRRSRSATKSTTLKERFPERRSDESKDDSLKLLQRTPSKIEVQRKTRSACTSPSAWALSSGRLSASPVMQSRGGTGRVARLPALSPVVPVPNLSSSGKLLGINNKGGKLLSGFWNFLKQNKLSPAQQQEYHQFRLMQTTLLQWRFANARAELSFNTIKRIAQKKLLNVWVRNSITRNRISEKRIEIQRLKHEMKLWRIFNSELELLKEWTKLEGKNSEALGRLARKLSAVSNCLPLANAAKAEVASMHQAMTNALNVLEGITDIIGNIHSKIETTCYMLTELIIFLKEQEGYVIELEKHLTRFLPLEVTGESLSVHCIQLIRESKRNEGC